MVCEVEGVVEEVEVVDDREKVAKIDCERDRVLLVFVVVGLRKEEEVEEKLLLGQSMEWRRRRERW